jgi:alcohol dehydrogenase (cytochrome c)
MYGTVQFAMRYLAAGLVAVAMGIAFAQTADDLIDPPRGAWPSVNRTLDGLRFSPLDQITPDNVADLRLVWSRALGYEGDIQSSPAVWNGVMYINGVMGVQALDAVTGDLIWDYRRARDDNMRGFFLNRMRGAVVVFEGNVYYASNDGYLVALDAESGDEVFATQLTDITRAEGFSAGPIFADGKIIAGTTGADAGGAPGRIHAVDAVDGELLWTFEVMPGPEDAEAYASWNPMPPSWDDGVGGASPWNTGIFDPVTRTVIYGTGQPTPWDRFDGRRADPEGAEPSADLYSSSYVAVDVDTGELKWYFQVVPADEWDYDVQTTPFVTDMEFDGATRRIVVLPSTPGYLILIDAETGEFLTAHGGFNPEYTVLLGFTDDGEPIINPEARDWEEGDTYFLAPMRWTNFQAASYDPDRNLYFRPNVWDSRDYRLYSLAPDWEPGDSATDFEFTVHYDRYDRYGGISAINPVTGEVVWDYGHGYDQRGGLVATAAGLVFAVFEDRHVRAFDSDTGEVLWEQVLPSMMRSNPITYEVDGVQYVAFLTGHPTGGQARADLPPLVPGPAQVFVYALPAASR